MIFRAGPDAYNDGLGNFIVPALKAADPANAAKFPRGDGSWQSITTTLAVNLTGAALAGTGNLHFEVQISASPDFSAPLVTANSATSQTGFEFWNGDSVQPFPAEGLPAQYRDAQFGCVMFGWTGASYGIAYYVRVRAWDGATWGEYRVWRITA